VTRFLLIAGLLALWLVIPQVLTVWHLVSWAIRLRKSGQKSVADGAVEILLQGARSVEFETHKNHLHARGTLVLPEPPLPDIVLLHMLLWPVYWSYDKKIIEFNEAAVLSLLEGKSD